MIAIIPIVLVMPASFVLIPPAMVLLPAALPRFAQFAPLVVGLPAVPTVVLDCFMQLVLGMFNAALTPLVDILARLREYSRRSY